MNGRIPPKKLITSHSGQPPGRDIAASIGVAFGWASGVCGLPDQNSALQPSCSWNPSRWDRKST